MNKGKWIRNGVVVGLVCLAVGGAHAQSSLLRDGAAVGESVVATRAGQTPHPNSVWSYLTGVISHAVERAMKMQTASVATPVADDRIFDL